VLANAMYIQQDASEDNAGPLLISGSHRIPAGLATPVGASRSFTGRKESRAFNRLGDPRGLEIGRSRTPLRIEPQSE
jgi:hypothetical protein